MTPTASGMWAELFSSLAVSPKVCLFGTKGLFVTWKKWFLKKFQRITNLIPVFSLSALPCFFSSLSLSLCLLSLPVCLFWTSHWGLSLRPSDNSGFKSNVLTPQALIKDSPDAANFELIAQCFVMFLFRISRIPAETRDSGYHTPNVELQTLSVVEFWMRFTLVVSPAREGKFWETQ